MSGKRVVLPNCAYFYRVIILKDAITFHTGVFLTTTIRTVVGVQLS
jgi:hypothetical protein